MAEPSDRGGDKRRGGDTGRDRVAAPRRRAASDADRSAAGLALQRLRRHPMAVAGGGTLLLLALLAAAAPLIGWVLGLDATTPDLFSRNLPPSAAHPLGTDGAGRDLLMRLLYGGRVSLIVGLVAAVLASVIGTVVGLVAGHYGGRVDAVLMRVTDAVIALPILPLLIVLAAIDLGKVGLGGVQGTADASLYKVVAIVSLFGWTTVARLVRGATLAVREQTYVTAARSLGAGGLRIMAVHILPNVASPIIVATTLAAGEIILLESVLSFLGLGIQPPVPSWGNMLTGAQDLIWSAPHLAIWPGGMIFVTVIAFNLLGDGLQDALDPRSS